MANGRTLEVGQSLVRTLVTFSRHIRLHLQLDCPTSRNSPWISLAIFNHRILNYKIIVELLRDRVGLGHGNGAIMETGESQIGLLEVTLWIGAGLV